ncbi:MAG: sulfatase-like hydrolase/transferase [Clostridia bacterium]
MLNFLWICTDSQRFDTLGCNGNSFVRTPNIDRLARSGANLTRVFSQSPLCTPSRGCFMTGRYPATMGLRQNGQSIQPDEVLVSKLLADAGYTCGLVGKLHLSACDYRIKKYGRTEWWRYPQETYFEGVEERIDDGYTEFEWDHAPSTIFPESAYTKWLTSHGATFATTPHPDCDVIAYGMQEELHQTTFCANHAIDFIDRHQGQPWFYSVNIFDPHFTFDPPKQYLDRYEPLLNDIPLPVFTEDELEGKPKYQKDFVQAKGHTTIGRSAHEIRLIKAAYWAMIDLIDVQVGRIMEALKASGQDKNTVVIFTSDHGEMLGDHQMLKKGGLLYDSATHVPLVMSCPGVIPLGQTLSPLYELGDLAPTILEAAGLAKHPGMQLESFWKQITGQEQPCGKETVYCEYYNANPDKVPQYLTMLRADQIKIIVHHGETLGELYDLYLDPHELNNLWDHPAYQSIKHDWIKATCDTLAFHADPLPARIGIY